MDRGIKITVLLDRCGLVSMSSLWASLSLSSLWASLSGKEVLILGFGGSVGLRSAEEGWVLVQMPVLVISWWVRHLLQIQASPRLQLVN